MHHHVTQETEVGFIRLKKPKTLIAMLYKNERLSQGPRGYIRKLWNGWIQHSFHCLLATQLNMARESMCCNLSEQPSYRWIILFAACLTYSFTSGFTNGFMGTIGSYFSHQYHERTLSSSIGGIQMAVTFLAGECSCCWVNIQSS